MRKNESDGMKPQAKPGSRDVVSNVLVARGAKAPGQQKPEDGAAFHNIVSSVSSYFPNLKKQMTMAGMADEPHHFIKKALFSAFYFSFAILTIIGIGLWGTNSNMLLLIPAAPVVYVAMFFYVMQFPSVKANQRAKNIDQELVFAGRHMLIALKAGVPLFDSMLGITRDYGEVSKEFNKIIEKVTLGVPMSLAIHEVTETNPSSSFKRMMLQITNSMSSGSDVAAGLEVVLEQISKEQIIAMKEYGQKLNPLAMFFMIFGVILPSLGVAFMIIVLSFIGGGSTSLGASALLGIFALIAVIQFIFLSMIETSRPKFDIA